MQAAVLDGRLERALHPSHADGVHVRVQEQRLPAARAARDADRVEAPGRDLLDLDLEPRALEPVGDEAGDLPLARRALDQVGVDRVDADEVAEQLRQSHLLRDSSAASFERAVDELDLEALDPLPVHLDDLEAEAVVLDLVAGLRRPAELAEDEARDRVVVLLRQVRPRTAR